MSEKYKNTETQEKINIGDEMFFSWYKVSGPIMGKIKVTGIDYKLDKEGKNIKYVYTDDSIYYKLPLKQVGHTLEILYGKLKVK